MTKWMTQNWTSGQLNALVKKLGGEEVARGILDGTVPFTVTARAHEFLRTAGELTLPASTVLFDPAAYFQTRKGLWVSDSFRHQILKYAHGVDSTARVTLSVFDLVKSANDAEIRSELPEDHVFEDASEFSATLAKMIDLQPIGKDGILLTSGYWNIFYVQRVGGVVAVFVYWHGHARRWYVYARPLDDLRWFEGRRAFSRSC